MINMQCVASCSYAPGVTGERNYSTSACVAPARCNAARTRCSTRFLAQNSARGPASTCCSSSRKANRSRGRCLVVHASGSNGAGPDTQGKPEFGYTRKDIILIGGGLIGFGFALYYGLQAAGVDALVAGNYVQLFVFVGICLGYISTYFYRVANKDMTYVKQLKDYENAVIAKRLEEMPETEKERLAEEVAAERAAADERQKARESDQGRL